MEQSIIYNNVILNNLFAPREFKFINQIDTDIDKIDALISKELSNKNVITIFTENLHNMIKTDNFSISVDTTSSLISEVKNILDLVNSNIKMLESNKQNYDEIKKSIIDLLVKAEYESNSTNQFSSSTEMRNIRSKINSFATTLENTKSKIFLNDIKIDNFFNKPIVKKYLLYCSSGIQNIAGFEQDLNFNNSDLNNNDVNSISSDEDMGIVADVSEKSTITNNTNGCTEEDMNKHSIKKVQESNSILLVSERKKKVYLPYSKQEVLTYLEQYPTQYKSFSDVVEQEFIFPIDFYMKHTVISRFRESYSLLRDRESKSVLESLKFALDTMFNYSLNPAVIAACKSQEQLENYLFCVQHKKLEDFKDFEIKFDVAPIG